uniref:Leucine zipper protein, putative n=1 Tax=Schistosoma mansoni TaxID=6183 RepID=A0A5K4F055_SCHMA
MRDRKEFLFENPVNDTPVDVRRVKLISQSEWKRLRNQMDSHLSETAKIEEKKLQIREIKTQSREMVKNWTNTLLGSRQKKLEDRSNRLAEEEKCRMAIDREEEKFQAERRKKAVDKAKQLLYYETDRFRLLHSGLNLTETLKERDMQLEFKRLKNKSEVNKGKKYVETMRKSIEGAIMKELNEAERRHEKNLLNAQELMAQIKEHDEQKKRHKEQILAEGEALRKIATTDLLEREKLDQICHDQMRKLAKEFQDQINGHIQMKEIEKLCDEEIEEQCRLFAAAKIKMTKMRIMKERDMFQQKEAELQKIQEYLSEQLKNAHTNEEVRLNRATTEKEEKYQQDTKKKYDKQLKIIQEVKEYRVNEIERRRKRLEDEKQIELCEIRKKIAAELALTEYENALKTKKLEERKQLSQQLLQESVVKREQAKEERKAEIEAIANRNKLIQLEEIFFQDYASRVINHCKANGRNVYPLEKAAHTGSMTGLGTGLPGKPSLVTINMNHPIDDQHSNDQSTSTNDQCYNEEMRNNVSLNGKLTNKKINNTNERLGFVW